MSDYFKTSERPPTEADGNESGNVLCWDKGNSSWFSYHWQEVAGYPLILVYWMPQPPPPKSASDEAFEAYMMTAPSKSWQESHRASWNAAVAWQKGQAK